MVKKKLQTCANLLIKSTTPKKPEKNHENLLKELKIKDQDYISNYYFLQKHKHIRHMVGNWPNQNVQYSKR